MCGAHRLVHVCTLVHLQEVKTGKNKPKISKYTVWINKPISRLEGFKLNKFVSCPFLGFIIFEGGVIIYIFAAATDLK